MKAEQTKTGSICVLSSDTITALDQGRILLQLRRESLFRFDKMLANRLPDQNEEHGPGRPRVLVVDDYRGAAIGIATYLSLDGIETRVAGGCGDALETIRNWLPDLVLLDIWMPQRDGFETADAIRHCIPAPRPLVLAYTCAEEQFVMANVASESFDGYCRKGTSPPELVLIVKSLCATAPAH